MNILSLGNGHKPIDALMAWMNAPQDGMLLITGEGVTWCLDFFQGRLRYCNHSQQTYSAVELHLQALGYETAIEPSRRIFYQQSLDRPQSNAQVSPQAINDLAWTHHLVQQLAIQGTLSWEQANVVMTQLTKDSLEPALWLTSGTITPLADASTIYGTDDTRWQGSQFDVLMQILLKRLQVWQQLTPHIQSPHQCPFFTDVHRIYETVPEGVIPTSMLLALKHIMGGISLRQLSQVLKQDELKLAQLLYPYVKQGVVVFDPPEPSLSDLPLIQLTGPIGDEIQTDHIGFNYQDSLSKPQSSVTSQVIPSQAVPSQPLSSPLVSPSTSKTSVNKASNLGSHAKNRSQKPEKKQYKIVCIDDSPTMLETLRCYLEDDCFDVTTLENPMQSASTMFSSRPDLVLMDVAMPGIKGDRLCKLLRQSSAFKSTPIIMVTGLTQDVDKAGAIAMGANDYLAKPFSQEALLELVDQYLHFSE